MKNQTGKYQARSLPFFILGIFFLSGLCGLIYEVVWARQFILVFGVTTLSVSTILTVFMGGLALGSWWFGRIANPKGRLLTVYAFLEMGIGLYALFLVVVFPHLPALYSPILQFFGEGYWISVILRFSLSAALLILPTTLMGGTLPVLGGFFVQTFNHLGKRLGILYAVNTFGGVAGSFLTGFFLLNFLGAALSTVLAALTNLALGAFALWLARSWPGEGPLGWEGKEKKEKAILLPKFHTPPAVLLVVFGVSGFAALAYEVLWTRTLVFILGSHTYAFTTLLMAFLMGIALGGAAFARVADGTRRPALLLFILQVLIGLSALVLIGIFKRIPDWFAEWAQMTHTGWWKFVGLEFLVCFLLMLLPTFCMGGTFPLVMKLYVSDLKRRSRQIGRAYMVNTVGAILGAFMAGFVFIPWLGIQRSIAWMAGFNLSVAVGLLLMSRFLRVKTRLLASGAAFLLFFSILWNVPLTMKLQPLGSEEKLLFYEENYSATVAVKEAATRTGTKVLTVNGLEEVPLDYASLQTFRFLGHFPLLIHPDPRKVLVVSFGAGIATGSASLHRSVEIEAVEICPAVPRAARLYSRENHRVLENPRVRLLIQDGRNYIATTRKKYDVITADATHPWSADSWVLYTKEFYQLCKNQLNPGGIMIQWLPLHWLAPRDYRTLLRTFKLVFPHTSLWFTNSYTIMVATPGKLAIDYTRLMRRFEEEALPKDLGPVGMGEVASLLGFFLMGEGQIDRFLSKGETNTDDQPLVEFSAHRSFGLETTSLNLAQMAPFREKVTPYLINLPAGQNIMEKIDRFYQSRSLLYQARIAHFQGDFEKEISLYERVSSVNGEDSDRMHLKAETAPLLADKLVNQAKLLRSKGERDRAIELCARAIRIDPLSSKAYNNLGIAYFEKKEFNKALEAYLQAVKVNPDQLEIRYNLALLYLVVGQNDKAAAEIREVLRLGSHLSHIQNIISELEKRGYSVR
ncbi:MAG: fused MFS/spermidine synthase [Thermodesulfobacteriota bacterium]